MSIENLARFQVDRLTSIDESQDLFDSNDIESATTKFEDLQFEDDEVSFHVLFVLSDFTSFFSNFRTKTKLRLEETVSKSRICHHTPANTAAFTIRPRLSCATFARSGSATAGKQTKQVKQHQRFTSLTHDCFSGATLQVPTLSTTWFEQSTRRLPFTKTDLLVKLFSNATAVETG